MAIITVYITTTTGLIMPTFDTLLFIVLWVLWLGAADTDARMMVRATSGDIF